MLAAAVPARLRAPPATKTAIAATVLAGVGLAALMAAGPAAAQQRDYSISVINGTSTSIEFFQFSACGNDNWMHDRLGANEVIAAGASRNFDLYDGIEHCCRDMKATFSNKVARTWMNVDVCSISEWIVR
jgi:hypothetical protein